MKFAPEGHDYNGFTQYFFEGKELEFLEILLSGKDKQHCCCKSDHVSSLGRYVFGSEISYNKAPPRLPGLGC